MLPELQTLTKVIQRLDNAGLPYMLTGSMALNFYGQTRATNDFDIVIAIQSGDLDTMMQLFQTDFYISRDAVKEALRQKSHFNIIDNEVIFKVDCFIKREDSYSEQQFQRRQLKDLGELNAYVISREDLILAKLEWSQESLSEMQERDIRNLLHLNSSELDYAYLEKWAKQKGMLDRLRSFYA